MPLLQCDQYALNGTDLPKTPHQKGLDSNQLLVKNPPLTAAELGSVANPAKMPL